MSEKKKKDWFFCQKECTEETDLLGARPCKQCSNYGACKYCGRLGNKELCEKCKYNMRQVHA